MTKHIDPADLSAAIPASSAETPMPGEIAFDPAAPRGDEGPGEPAAPPAAAPEEPAFTPVPLRPSPTGWTAFRQRRFLEALAETGSVTAAAEEAGASVRSAYRLRQRPDGRSFAAAWDRALTLAARNLLDIAMHRATIGSPRGIWRGGELVGEEDVPSDRLLIFLLSHLQPTRFGKLSGLTSVPVKDPVRAAERRLPAIVEELTDIEMPADPDIHESYTILWDEPDPSADAPARPTRPMRSLARKHSRTRKRGPRTRTEA